MTYMRISEVAALLRVSDDTVRRWVDQGRLRAEQRPGARTTIDSAQVAELVLQRRSDTGVAAEAGGSTGSSVGSSTGSAAGSSGAPSVSSARNRLEGIVTEVKRDGLMAQVEIQAGPFRVVSLMTREAADELGLEFGSLATAVVKATTVLVESTPREIEPNP